jgi:2-polyprenyl-3-methyl-5-hydroxy-6-metoxy-1,4-benzoquinol methylase
MNSSEEINQLNRISQQFDYGVGVNALMIKHCASLVKTWARPGSLLEMGPADGLSTFELAKSFPDLEVVDGVKAFIQTLGNKLPHIKSHLSLFEEFNPMKKYDNIFMGHVLEHVIDPGALLVKSKNWCAPKGRIIASVPNADSIHREIGLRMGLLRSKNELNDSDKRIGHRRVFSRKEFEELFLNAGFRIIYNSGFFLKFLSNAELEEIFDVSIIEELMKLGEKTPEYSAEIFLVAEPN